MPDPLLHTSSSLQIAVIYNPEDKSDGPELALTDSENNISAATIADSLRKCGYQTSTYAVSEKNLYYLKHKKADMFFNMCEREGLYIRVIRQLEKYGRIFSGTGHDVMKRTLDKIATKQIFEHIGVTTPKWQEFVTGKETPRADFQYPLIVKPTKEDCSIGISIHSIVHNKSELLKQVKQISTSYKQMLSSKSLFRQRTALHIVGNGKDAEALPLAELEFPEGYAKDDNFIFDYEAKWIEDSPRHVSRFVSPSPSIGKDVTEKIQADARRAFLALGMKDYARFDIRYNSNTKTWYFLEANANPSIENMQNEATVRSASASGMEYHEFIQHIVESCKQRTFIEVPAPTIS
jgi:D-alanine-D-alanine ligase